MPTSWIGILVYRINFAFCNFLKISYPKKGTNFKLWCSFYIVYLTLMAVNCFFMTNWKIPWFRGAQTRSPLKKGRDLIGKGSLLGSFGFKNKRGVVKANYSDTHRAAAAATLQLVENLQRNLSKNSSAYLFGYSELWPSF